MASMPLPNHRASLDRLSLVPLDGELSPARLEAPAPEPQIRVNLLVAWPETPVSPWANGELTAEAERAQVEFGPGRMEAGEVLCLDPASGLLFRAADGVSRERWLRFDEFKSVCLTRPLGLSAPPAGPSVLRRRFRLEGDDGQVRLGESAGDSRTAAGLFLYPPAGDAEVARLFVPAARVAKFEWIASPKTPVRLDLEDIVMPGDPPPRASHAAPALEAPAADVHVPDADGPITTLAGLRHALAELARRPMRKLGEALIESGHIDAAQLDKALALQKTKPGMPLGEILVETGAVKPEQLKHVLAQKLGIPSVDARRIAVDPGAQRLVPIALCQRHRLMPLYADDAGGIVVVMDNPMSGEALEALRFATGKRVVPVLGTWSDIRTALGSHARDVWNREALFGDSATETKPAPSKPGVAVPDEDSLEFDLTGVSELTSRLTLETPIEEDEATETVRESDSTLVRLVNKIILDAKESGASDIHFEPAPGKHPTRIRMRRDGVLSDYAEVPAKFRAALVSRIKIMASLDISERRKPQDGKIDFSRFGPVRLELRVATIPTVQGLESVILRLLAATEPLPAEKLGLEARVLADLKALTARPHGLILVCGPTGSGKTTTLHSLISMINTPERKIWTAEDPVEITQEGLSQVHVNPKIGWTFAGALRAFLRADPDVIMIGEMRDKETAEIAVEASLTGHLVFSTLHTNSAPETVTRLLDLGVDPFNFGDSLMGVLAQRLVRRVCPACARRQPFRDDEASALAAEYVAGTILDPSAVLADWRVRHGKEGALWRTSGAGCDECGGTGFRGRLGVHEFMRVEESLKALIQARSPAQALREKALAAGMRTLKQDGFEKALMGLTTVEQVRGACA
jgi:type II secretory ATPase GspE/PulE/Tfp pilus assembly ATPase PilB-like protein